MKETKIQFSPAETELMCNAEIILTKNKALQKVKALLENLQSEMQLYTKDLPPLYYANPFLIDAKISRGENYLGLPYLVLDYPRNFGVEDTFAIRTMFWWGNFFSTTLYLAGDFKKAYSSKFDGLYDAFCQQHYYIGINDDPWIHHFEADNYMLISSKGKEAFGNQIENSLHLKIAKKIPLRNWTSLPEELLENWKLLVNGCLY